MVGLKLIPNPATTPVVSRSVMIRGLAKPTASAIVTLSITYSTISYRKSLLTIVSLVQTIHKDLRQNVRF